MVDIKTIKRKMILRIKCNFVSQFTFKWLIYVSIYFHVVSYKQIIFFFESETLRLTNLNKCKQIVLIPKIDIYLVFKFN